MRIVAIRLCSLLILALIATGTLSTRPRLTYAQSPTPAMALPIGNGEVPLFPVEKDGKWGYIDRSGRIVIAPQFYSADRFSDGVAAVTLNDGESHRGYVDETGKVVAIPQYPPRFGRRAEFHEGLALVDVPNPNRAHDGRNDLTGFIDKT